VKFAARSLAAFGLRLMVETVNHRDLPGFFLNRIEHALALLDRVEEPNVFLNLNLHPTQRENEDLVPILRNHLARIGHIQLGSHPGGSPAREPVINDLHLFEELDRLGYQDLVGLQQLPGPEPVFVKSSNQPDVSLGFSPGFEGRACIPGF
jgi:hydroxypyruvate isomerase